MQLQSFGQGSRVKISALLVYTAEQEQEIEKMRQILCSMEDFEPYTAFKRIDRGNTGFLDQTSLCQFQRENGFRELKPNDFLTVIRYFDLDQDHKINYHDFLQMLLPCEDTYLRAAATQRPSMGIPACESLPMRVERALSQLIFKEVRFQLKSDQMKRTIENCYDFSIQKAFSAIDDWSYRYLDQQNLDRFLKSCGHFATKKDIVCILRRLDLDGDARINFVEFKAAMKSTLTVFNGSAQKKRPSSGSTISRVKAQIPATPNNRKKAYVEVYTLKKSIQKSIKRIDEHYTCQPPAVMRELTNFQSRKLISRQKSSLLQQDSPRTSKQVSFKKTVKVREFPSSQKYSRFGAELDLENQDPVNLDVYTQREGSPLRQTVISPKNKRHQSSDYSPLKRSSSCKDYSPARYGQLPACIKNVEHSELTRVIKEIVFIEREVESAKIDLALKTDFNLVDAFRLFDTKHQSYITQQHLEEGLRLNLGFEDFTRQDIQLFIRNLDQSGKGSVNFSEFSEAILPFSSEYAQLVTDRPEYYNKRDFELKQYFTSNTRTEFQHFWHVIFGAERQIEDLRQRLQSSPGFQYPVAFQFFDRDNDGLLKQCDFRDLLADVCFYVTDRELQGLMHRLDRKKHNKISLQDFTDQLMPRKLM